MEKKWSLRIAPPVALLLLVLELSAVGLRSASAQFDAMDGPVVADARAALDKGNIAPALKWIRKEDENELRNAFNQALAARVQGAESQTVADRCFVETLARLFHKNQGQTYTGLKPAGGGRSAVVSEAEKALEQGSDGALIKFLTDRTAVGIRRRFSAVRDKRRRADQSVEAGRDYVDAYVEYLRYLEKIFSDTAGEALRPGGRE